MSQGDHPRARADMAEVSAHPTFGSKPKRMAHPASPYLTLLLTTIYFIFNMMNRFCSPSHPLGHFLLGTFEIPPRAYTPHISLLNLEFL